MTLLTHLFHKTNTCTTKERKLKINFIRQMNYRCEIMNDELRFFEDTNKK